MAEPAAAEPNRNSRWGRTAGDSDGSRTTPRGRWSVCVMLVCLVGGGAGLLFARMRPGPPHFVDVAITSLVEARTDPARTIKESLAPRREEASLRLIEIARAGNEEERLAALFVVEELVYLEHTDAVIAILLTDPNPRMRAAAARTLGILDQPRAIPALARTYRDPEAFELCLDWAWYEALFSLTGGRPEEGLDLIALDVRQYPGLWEAWLLKNGHLKPEDDLTPVYRPGVPREDYKQFDRP